MRHPGSADGEAVILGLASPPGEYEAAQIENIALDALELGPVSLSSAL